MASGVGQYYVISLQRLEICVFRLEVHIYRLEIYV